MEPVASRYQWADITLQTLQQTLGHSAMLRSVLCTSGGSDSDFTGGAAAFEHAAAMLQSSGHRNSLDIDLATRSICVTCLLWIHFKFVPSSVFKATMFHVLVSGWEIQELSIQTIIHSSIWGYFTSP